MIGLGVLVAVASLFVSACASSDGTCVTDAPVTICATNISDAVEVSVRGGSSFTSGTVGVPEATTSSPIPPGTDGRLPEDYRTVVDVPEGSLIEVQLADGGHTLDISVRASG